MKICEIIVPISLKELSAVELSQLRTQMEPYRNRAVPAALAQQIKKKLHALSDTVLKNITQENIPYVSTAADIILGIRGYKRMKTIPNPLGENFADGKGPGKQGDSKRAGIRKGATIAQLKKIRSSSTASPRKKQLAHWQINMRQGRSKHK